MSGRAIFVTGLPASGKTAYLAEIARETHAERLDDFKADAIDNNRRFPYSRHYQTLITWLNEGRTVIVADIDFCQRPSQTEAEYYVRSSAPGAAVEWRYFANDPEQCTRNATRRAAETQRDLARELQLITEYSSCYHVPEGAITIPVWRPRTT